MTCNGICNTYKANKPKEGGRYENGQKRCQTCEIFVYHDGLYCPCCKTQLRQSSRYIKLKEKAVPLIRL
ncbi:hypothetical protein SCCGRSA3_00847 [Marine Group I thaumarchaeote SCGC RSA3]|uniref:Uncharacterized protein n=1 Tax=Marine Group I thaumarchaeote SCGC RSA3 TaxID=1503183 RepID=A0A087RZQ1_9ARCH|nr:hypothetical protein SCCGRSA3_00847 [Marine Group I thaumarchaeote SCGC RSA3]